GDVDRLPLAGEDALDRLDLGAELELVLADDRHPRRRVEPLVGEDVAADRDAEHDQPQQREARLGVAAERLAEALPHRPSSAAGWAIGTSEATWAPGVEGEGGGGASGRAPSAGPIEEGPLTSGTALRWQGTSRRSGGTLFGNAGRVRNGLEVAL